MYPIVHDLQTATWVASDQSTVFFERVPPQLAGAMAHISAILLKLKVTITADAANDTPGDEICRVISGLKVIDRFGDLVVDLRGHQLRTCLKLVTGRVGGGSYSDPADISSGAGAGQVRYVYVRIPFHGGRGGVLGVRGYSDVIQPVDRFKEGRMEISWGTATPFQAANTGTVTAATLYPSVELDVRREIIQGMDIRYRFGTYGDAQSINVSIMGEGVMALAITNPDLDHSDYTAVTIRELVRAINVRPDTLMASWNAECALSDGDFENPLANQFLPLIFPRREGKLLGAAPYRKGRLEIELTNTNATDQEFVIVEQYNTNVLARKMSAVPQTLTYGRVLGRPKTLKRTRMQPQKLAMIRAVAPVKMMTPAEAKR